jgi:hypothetical protein
VRSGGRLRRGPGGAREPVRRATPCGAAAAARVDAGRALRLRTRLPRHADGSARLSPAAVSRRAPLPPNAGRSIARIAMRRRDPRSTRRSRPCSR